MKLKSAAYWKGYQNGYDGAFYEYPDNWNAAAIDEYDTGYKEGQAAARIVQMQLALNAQMSGEEAE